MNNWINLSALWRIVGLGLLAGAGLPAIFALGVRALGTGSQTDESGRRGAGDQCESSGYGDRRVVLRRGASGVRLRDLPDCESGLNADGPVHVA